MKRTLILILISVSITSYGQIKRKDLIGTWISDNGDSLYFKRETIMLFNDANYHNFIDGCNLIRWEVTRNRSEFTLLNNCVEPGRITGYIEKQSLKLKSKDNKKFLHLKWNNKVIEKFEIISYEENRVDRYPWDIKIMKLKRK